VFLRSHYGLTRCHNFQFEKHVSEILSRPFHYSSFSRIVSADNEDVFSNKAILCCRGRRKIDTFIRSRAVFIHEPRKSTPIDRNVIKLIRKPVKIAGFFPWYRAGNWLDWTTRSVVSYEKWCHMTNYLLISLARDRTEEYWPSVRTATTSANIPQYGPRVQLVRTYSYAIWHHQLMLQTSKGTLLDVLSVL